VATDGKVVLSGDAASLGRLVQREDFFRLVVGVVRVRLEKDYDQLQPAE
jgi:hypothetical protein